MKILVVGTPNKYQQEALDRLSAEGVEIVLDDGIGKTLQGAEVEMVITNKVRYMKESDFPVLPKEQRDYPTLRELQRRRGKR